MTDQNFAPAAPAAGLSGPVSRQSLTEQAYARIRRAIITCDMPPGSEFTEIDLAERLAMSKTPVREALARLQFDGLVRAFPRQGYQIAPIRIADIDDIFDMRIALETGIVELAARRASEAEIDELQAMAATLTSDAYSADPVGAHSANNSFHERLALTCGNARLHRSLMQIFDELERLFFVEARADSSYPAGHVSDADIVATLRQRDTAAARDAIRDHIDATRLVLIATIVGGHFSTLQL
jgi:DNA-binding GntR family transcriptional regulator